MRCNALWAVLSLHHASRRQARAGSIAGRPRAGTPAGHASGHHGPLAFHGRPTAPSREGTEM